MSYRQRVESLMKESIKKHSVPICFWCENVVVKYPLKDREPLPCNYATVDHLYSRTHPLRNSPFNGEQRIVLACHKCNHDRNENERILNG